jgi:hypothetical protein
VPTSADDITESAPIAVQIERVPAVDGTVVLSPDDSHIQTLSFDEYARVPFEVEGAVVALQTQDTGYAANPATGQVVLFDLSGTIVGSTAVPTSADTVRLRDVALGPEDTVYALYAGETGLTVVASTLESPGREIRRWLFGPDIAIACDAYCYFVPHDDGFSWEGGQTVPYLNAAGTEIAGPARPIDFGFATDWELDGEIPRAVTVTGPLTQGGALSGSNWSVRLEDVLHNDDLGASFERQADGSYIEPILFERQLNVVESRRLVFVWLRSDGSVSALDVDDVHPVFMVIVRPGDGTLIGVAKDERGLLLGTLGTH